MIFTEFSPFTPESDSITLSRIFCEKLQSTPINVRSSSRLIASISSGLLRRRDMPRRRRPLRLRLERHEILRVVEARRVGAVVGAADLHDDRLHLGVLLHNVSAEPGATDCFIQRRVQREGAPNPEVAFLQFGHEFAAQEWQGAGRGDQHAGQRRQGQPAMVHAAAAVAAGRSLAAGGRGSCRLGTSGSSEEDVHSTGESVNASSSAPARAKA